MTDKPAKPYHFGRAVYRVATVGAQVPRPH